MFTIRPYREEDTEGCGRCFYEGFFTCPINENDRIFLRDYAQVLIEKCSFAYVAEASDHQIVAVVILAAAVWRLPLLLGKLRSMPAPLAVQKVQLPSRK